MADQGPYVVEETSPTQYALMYGPVRDEPYPIPAVNLSKIDPKFYRRQVRDPTGEKPGTLVVDTPSRYLYLVQERGMAMRYGIGIGRQGFDWAGDATIKMKREWPTWTPPPEMVDRQPELEKYRDGMEPGVHNPLGARALYLFEGNRDTLYRLHGTQEAFSIGRAVSSGCVRLLNQDIIDLYNRVPVNSKVKVRPLDAPALSV
ncbi:L,D-transpeptidase [Acuticoccus kandeliae]|uniref:L,D-transpeptidase n=1 Tax=Acuticoccus kandeliae TaxID=2073160 RepID=UPI000D3E0846|nr:L,D-transpeptidase [Acuticoccus kandeliae]